jgi:hypothetical protein
VDDLKLSERDHKSRGQLQHTTQEQGSASSQRQCLHHFVRRYNFAISAKKFDIEPLEHSLITIISAAFASLQQRPLHVLASNPQTSEERLLESLNLYVDTVSQACDFHLIFDLE